MLSSGYSNKTNYSLSNPFPKYRAITVCRLHDSDSLDDHTRGLCQFSLLTEFADVCLDQFFNFLGIYFTCTIMTDL